MISCALLSFSKTEQQYPLACGTVSLCNHKQYVLYITVEEIDREGDRQLIYLNIYIAEQEKEYWQVLSCHSTADHRLQFVLLFSCYNNHSMFLLLSFSISAVWDNPDFHPWVLVAPAHRLCGTHFYDCRWHYYQVPSSSSPFYLGMSIPQLLLNNYLNQHTTLSLNDQL